MRRVLLFFLLLLMLGAAYVHLALYRPYQGFPNSGVYVDIPHGASQRTIARLLDQNGVVRSQIAFEWLCRWRKRRTLEAGEYFFDRPADCIRGVRCHCQRPRLREGIRGSRRLHDV